MRDMDTRALSTERERRRYALLQAAATLARYAPSEELDVESSVIEAEMLLEEIEKREKAGAES